MKIKHFLIFFLIGANLSQLLVNIKNQISINVNIAFVMAAITFMILQFITTYYIKSIKLIIVLLMISSSCFYLIDHELSLIICLCFTFALLKILLSMDEVVMIYEGNYGKLRAYGAIGMASGAILASLLFHYRILLVIMIISVGLISLFYNYCYEIKKDNNQLRLNKQMILIILIYFTIYTITALDQYLVIEKMIALKASKLMIGLKWALQAICEIPALFVLDKIAKKINYYYLLLLAILMYVIKFLGYGYFNHSILIVLCACLQLVTLPLINYTSKMYLGKNKKSQMIASVFFNGLSLVFAPLLSMYLLKVIGYDHGLYFCAIGLMIVGIFVIFIKKTLKSN